MQKLYYSFIVLLIGFFAKAQTTTTPITPTPTPSPVGIGLFAAPIGGGGGAYKWNADRDRDGFGDPNDYVYANTKPYGYVSNQSDLDDTNPKITNIRPQTFYLDADGDTFGNPNASVYYSVKPSGYVANNTDCNDQDFNSNPNTKWYADVEGDGLGDPASFVTQCTAPAGYVLNATDNCPNVPGTNADCGALPNPSQDMNYIITRAYQQATSTPLVAPSPEQAQVQITYFDGLGRPIQQIANQQSSTGKDIVTPIEYDAFGRQTKDYLPYVPNAAASLNYKPSALTDVLNFPQYYGQNPFSEKLFEASPLLRVLKQAAPGIDWALNSGHEIKLDYQTNTANEVKRFDVSLTSDYVPSITANANYAVGELYKTVTTDENGHTTEEFKDKEGHVVLKRNYDSSVAHDTYYVYDVYGNLTYVLPPKAEGATTAAVLDDLCYQYQYDYRNRLVAKKLPGKQWEFMVYDKLDRVVATGPAFSPFSDVTSSGWLITKYDVFNRVVYTGWLNSPANNSTRGTMQQAQTNATTINESKQASGSIDGIAVNYSNNVLPNTFKLLTVNYYDNYAIPTVSTATNVEGQTVTTSTKGLATGSWVRVPTTSAEVKAETSYILYDAKFRPIRTFTTNYLGGYTSTDSKLDAFSGQLQYTIQKHKRTTGDSELVVKEAFTYSPQDRLIQHTHQINGGVVQLLADNTYDELGKLTSKKVGNTSATPLQKVDYSYNIRGWLTKINEIGSLQQGTDPADLFGFKINYNTVDGNVNAANKLYNGNIAETFWRTATDGGFVRNYGYKYDNLNRLKEANYQKSGQLTNMYNENLTYDKNGNIKNLSRNGDRDEQYLPIQIDNLGYNYGTNSNQLKSVTDATNNTSGFKDGNITGDDYVYDVNGNMTVDKNKNITGIVYNHLNLPTKIIFPTGNIVYFYTASGQKVQKVVTDNATVTTTDYLGGYQYKNAVLQFFPTVEGYVKNTPVSGTNTYSYVFNYTDHLGNTRLSYTKDTTTGSLKILEESNYYPFGLKHNSYNVDNFQPDYKYKYNGKELQDELGLNMYDYGARNYDPALGRWMNIDPLAETSRRFSPYTYALNNPVYFIDPDGMKADDWVSDGKTWEYRSDITSEKQAKAAGYSNYSDGKTNNTYSDGKNTVTLKENGKWSNSSNNIEKTAADHANPTEIAAAKVDRASLTEQSEVVANSNPGMTLDTDKINEVSSGVGLANDVKSTIITAAGAIDDLGTYSTALRVIGGATGAIQAIDSASNIYDSYSRGETPSVKDAVSLASGLISVGTTFLKVSNPVGIAIGVAQIGWGIYTLSQDK